jgi:RND family efflux transporter MFP subunit
VQENQTVDAGTLLVELRNDTQQAQVQRTEALLKGREADLDRARDSYDRARRGQHGVSPAEVKQAEAALHRARADCDVARADHRLAEAELAKTRLIAPWSGCVVKVFAEPGALVGPASSRPILILSDLSCRRVRVTVEELQALQVRPGQHATVIVEGPRGGEFAGRVTRVARRMVRDAPHSDAPGEYKDVHFREAWLALDGADELPVGLRVLTQIEVP